MPLAPRPAPLRATVWEPLARGVRALAAVACLGVLAACTVPPTSGVAAANDPPMTNAQLAQRTDNETLARLSGTAMVRGRVTLPPGTEFEALLIDPSRPELLASILGRHNGVLGRDVIDAVDDRIVAFAIPYDTSNIDPRQTYVVRATLSAGGQMLYRAERVGVVVRTGPKGTTLDEALVLIPVLRSANDGAPAATSR